MYAHACTDSCANVNPYWLSGVLPTLHWVKAGSPGSYSFPYDDESSTFLCSTSLTGSNRMSYEIEFCPQGANILV